MFLVTNENMGLCLYIHSEEIRRPNKGPIVINLVVSDDDGGTKSRKEASSKVTSNY